MGRGTRASVNVPNVFLRSRYGKEASYQQASPSVSRQPGEDNFGFFLVFKIQCLVRGLRDEEGWTQGALGREQEGRPGDGSGLCVPTPRDAKGQGRSPPQMSQQMLAVSEAGHSDVCTSYSL